MSNKLEYAQMVKELAKQGDQKAYCGNDWFKARSKPTVFDRITANEETLAEKLVYCLNSSSLRVIDSAGRLLAYENEVWGSTVLPGSFWTEYEEAIAATVAKLKEVEK